MRRAALLLHGALARLLLPPGFRSEFGEELASSLRARLEARRGLLAVATVATLELLDLLRTALREWWAVAMVASGAVRGLWADFRIAARSLSRARTFTVVTVTTLAVAIGANAAIFSLVDTVLIDPLEFPAADRLVIVAGSAPGTDMPEEFELSAEFYAQYREHADLLEDLGMFMAGEGTLRAADRVEQIFMVQALPTLFSTLGASPVLGRLPRPDELIGSVAVISHSIWTAWFGADPDVIGRSYEIAGGQRTIVGVMGPEFRFPDERTSVWIHATLGDIEDIRPGVFRFRLVGRTKVGVSRADLAQQLTALASRLPERVGGSPEYARIIERHRAVVRSLEEELVGNASRPLRLLFGTVAIVFLVACANVTNLMLVRGESRRRELSVRRALGAGRWGLIRLQMIEALVLATLGASLGWALGWVGLPMLLRVAPQNIPNLSSTRLDGAALLYTTGLATLAACALGLVPALRSSKSRRIAALGPAGPADKSSRGFARTALVTLQTASALVLLVASGLLLRSYWTLTQVDPGYETENVFTFQIATGRNDVNDPQVYRRFHAAFTQRLEALPGVVSVGLTAFLPPVEGPGSTNVSTETLRARGQEPLSARYTRVGGEYFGTMGIGLEGGRFFDPARDDVESVLVSRYAAERLWPGEDAVGKRVMTADTTRWRTVVGVVEDVLVDDLRQAEPEPMIYLPITGATPDGWTYDSPVYVIKSERGASVAADVRELIREVAPESPMYRVYTMDELAERKMGALSFTMLMIGMAAGLALMLGVVGLYGILAFLVSQRTAEIAVRIAVGAEARRVRRMVVVQGARLTAVGVAVGLVAAVGATRVLDSLLFGVGALDLPTFAVTAGLMIGVALIASWVPAFRASTVDPMQVLRSD